MSSGVTVCIPTIPERTETLKRAVNSVLTQTIAADCIIIEMDNDATGAPQTRTRALMKVTTPWVAFLDDDDWFKPEHLETLIRGQVDTDADYVFSYYEVSTATGQLFGDYDPVLGAFGKPFDPADPHQTTIVTMVRTELAQAVGFAFDKWMDHELVAGNRAGEDWMFTLGCLERGAKIVHVPKRSWVWVHSGENTSGRPWNQRGITWGTPENP